MGDENKDGNPKTSLQLKVHSTKKGLRDEITITDSLQENTGSCKTSIKSHQGMGDLTEVSHMCVNIVNKCGGRIGELSIIVKHGWRSEAGE